MSKFSYKWYKSDYPKNKHNSKVYTTFACGGGSTMGYKLAGYDVIGANDIDPQMAEVYKHNHNPKYYDLCPINELLHKDLPTEYFNLDILDGSPPCSTFSMSGSREKTWKKRKKFREGQSKQVLSDLFFDWIKLVERLRPKVAIAENVKGMVMGNAKGYTSKIIEDLESIGYDVQLFLLNAAAMGVPQRRERIFFICRQKELGLDDLVLSFKSKPILFKDIDEGNIESENKIANCDYELWKICRPGYSIASVHPKGNRFNSIKLSLDKVCNTIAAGSEIYHPHYARGLTNSEIQKIGTFPLDYDFLDIDVRYLVGMSVPPVMMAHVAEEVYKQWIFKISG